jgi:hypothetical protein
MTERIRIAHPRTDAARSLPARPPAREIDELTPLGELYLDSLMRSQRRTAVSVCLGTVGLLVGIAVLTAEVTGLDRLTVFGIRLPWLLLGVAVYPVLIGIGGLAVRVAERTERAFAELMEHR